MLQILKRPKDDVSDDTRCWRKPCVHCVEQVHVSALQATSISANHTNSSSIMSSRIDHPCYPMCSGKSPICCQNMHEVPDIRPARPTLVPANPLWSAHLRAMDCQTPCDRVVIISRQSTTLLAATNYQGLDSRKGWEERFARQEMLNEHNARTRNRLHLLVSHRIRNLLSTEWTPLAASSQVSSLISKYLYPKRSFTKIGDKYQLRANWNGHDDFYFFSEKWSIVRREGSDPSGYRSLLARRRHTAECLCVFQSRKAWTIVRARPSIDSSDWLDLRIAQAQYEIFDCAKLVFERIKENER